MKLVALAIAFAGCGKSAEECRSEAVAFGALLAAHETEAGPIWRSDAKLAARSDLSRLREDAPTLTIFPDRILDARGNSGPIAAVREVLQVMQTEAVARKERFAGTLRIDERRLYVLIDEATSWRDVVHVVDAAAKTGFTAPIFVFGLPVTITPPPRAPVDDELDRIGSDDYTRNKATAFAEITQKQVAECPSLIALFGAVASDDSESKSAIIVEGIAQALIDCRCNVPMADFRSTMFRLLVIPNPMRGLALDPDAPKQRIALRGTTPWSVASKQLTPATKNVELVVE